MIQRCAEQHRLTAFWRSETIDDPLHVRNETHVQHAIRFVDDQHFNAIQIHDMVAEIVDETAGRRHDKIDVRMEQPPLAIVVHAAIDGDRVEMAVGA